MLNVNALPDWQNLSVLSKNRLPSRSYFIPYEGEAECLSAPFFCDRREITSKRFMLLNGLWNFSYFRSVAFLPENFFDLDGKEEEVPSVWQAQGYEDWQYVNIDYPFPVNPPEIPNHNPVGVYGRKFTVPAEFKGKTVKINFLGVASSFHVYVNRKEVGYGQVSHSTNEYDITEYLNFEGENELCVVVYKWCEGSYLEDQDCFRLNGIFRDVFLIAQPKVHIVDYFFRAEKKDDLSLFGVSVDAALSDDAEIRLKLISPDGKVVEEKKAFTENKKTTFVFDVERPELWNAENPKNYTLLLSVGSGDEAEALKQAVGFKCAEIKNSTLYLNGVLIKIKGVNRHDSDPFLGYAVPFEHIKKDLLLIKSLNCNTVRTSHYPNDPNLVAMANFYGLYIVSEADLETHGFRDPGNGELDWNVLSKHPDWKNAYLDRLDKMLERDKNNPCVLFWSMGNESGEGDNIDAMIEYTKKRIPGALVHYCEKKDVNAQIYSFMYPEFAQVEEFGINKNNDPSIYFMCEYAHSMGIGPGSFKEYWDLIYKYPRLCGGCVWEWCDHAKGVKQHDGTVRWLYGGDNNDYPNNNNFCCDGIVLPDRTLSTGAYEMKEAYAPFRVTLDGGKLTVKNVLDFTSSDGFVFKWTYTEKGEIKESGNIELSIPAHGEETVSLPVKSDMNSEYSAFDISFVSKEDNEYKGHTSFLLSSEYKEEKESEIPLTIEENASYINFSGEDFSMKFSRFDGTFISYKYKGTELLKDGYVDGWDLKKPKGTILLTRGPRINLWRPLTDNDMFIRQVNDYTAENLWEKVSSAVITERKRNYAKIQVNGFIAAPLHTPVYYFAQTFTVFGDGRVDVTSSIKPYRKENLPFLPRFGLRFDMPADFESVTWLGLGDRENYSDFKLSAHYGLFNKKVSEMNDAYIKPQESGSRSECRFVRILNADGVGFELRGERLNFSARHTTIEELDNCDHSFEVRDFDLTEICVDGFMSGLGSNSCGPRPLPGYILEGNKEYSFTVSFKGISNL